MTEKKKRGRPKANRQIDKNALLNIAIEEFAKNGFEGAKQKEIARKAGIANSLMNYHFQNKDDLWRQAVSQLGLKLEKRFEDVGVVLKDLNGVSALKAYTRQFIYFSAEHTEFHRIVFHEMCTQTERADWLIENIMTPLHNLYLKNADRTSTAHLAVNGIPVANISSIIGGASSTFFLYAHQIKKMYDVDPFEKSQIEKHADIVIELIFNSLKS